MDAGLLPPDATLEASVSGVTHIGRLREGQLEVAFYPSYELGSDPAILRECAQAAEAAGYARLAMGEHVLGADPDRPGGWEGPYTYEQEWPEPFPTFGYLAALTERIELMTGVIILPQR